MQRITNISATARAAEILDRHVVMFTPRTIGDAFALTFVSSFVEADGTTVVGFRPGYSADSVSPQGLDAVWALAQPEGAPEFLFMPRFEWRDDEQYLVDVASEAFGLLSIGPVAR